MAPQDLARDDHFRNDGRPKRILALDGGGLRGILSLGILERIEALLRERHGGSQDFRLCHYFDLMAGTSTGAIIAAALAQGWSVAQVREKYLGLGRRVFSRSLLRHGFLRAKYDKRGLNEELKDVFGADTTLGSPRLLTGLVVVTKRLDTGSVWPLGNNPRSKFFATDSDGSAGNADYLLWEVVRASTAAPSYFEPESITISGAAGRDPVVGNFVDGGVSPFNDPSLLAFMYATLEGYRVGWPTGGDRLLLVSIGTGRRDAAVKKSNIAVSHAVRALASLMQDCAAQQRAMLQWMSESPTAGVIDREVGDLRGDQIPGGPLLSYLRYDVDLQRESVLSLVGSLDDAGTIDSLSRMDAPDNMGLLHRLGVLAGERDVDPRDFKPVFDLPPGS
ncbi:MAG: patatin-like phospholipase family protein [Arthrobacter sp.]|uniref:patatin-like phospholipase family protein n=1 Tax=Arthrobacter sp. TaxID=1667 RepID=UPI00347A9D8C